MAIVERRRGQDGTLWGWDDEAGSWLELDESAEQGSIFGNFGRAALRGFRDVGQGISELVQPEELNKIHPEAVTPAMQRRLAERESLEAETAAAATSAPVAETLGGAAPEIGAGLGVGFATAGLGLPAAILGQMGAGAATGFLRPGTTTERAANAAIGAVFGLAGEIPAGAQAMKGVVLGLKMGEAVTGRAAARSADILDFGLLRSKAGLSQQGGAAAPGGQPTRSAGAAATPEGELGEQALRESQALDIDEASGANVTSASDARDRAWAEENLGYKSPLGAGTHAGSAARMAEAVDEYTLGGSINKTYRAGNQKLLARTAAQAMGLPDAATKEVIELEDLALSKGRLENVFDGLERAAPDVDAETIADAIRSARKKGGVFEATKVEKWLDKTLENLKGVESQDGATMMANLRRIRDEATQASLNGDQHGAEQLLNLHQRLADIMERVASRRGNDEFVEQWKRANAQYRITRMLESGASVGATRDVNPRSLLNQMRKDRTKGGFGSQGPDSGTPERDLWRLVKLMAKDETGVPATGVRQLLVRAGPKIAAGAAGAAGITGLGSLLD